MSFPRQVRQLRGYHVPAPDVCRRASRSVLACLLAALFVSGCDDGCGQKTKWEIVGGMKAARAAHTATLLADGTVLVTGGFDQSRVLPSAEVYNPDSKTWSVVADMAMPRVNHTATRLPDGTVLVAGGITEKVVPAPITASAELYDPATRSWRSATPMTTGRAFHSAALLGDGTVLIASGGSGDDQWTAERYDPTTDKWTSTGNLKVPHTGGAAVSLPDGSALVAGGFDVGPERDDPTLSFVQYGERYIPGSDWGEFAFFYGGFQSKMAVLGAGTVLSTGGFGGVVEVTDAFLYSPQRRQPFDQQYPQDLWVRVASMNERRARHQTTLLRSGEVLVTGGEDGCVLQPHKCARSLDSAERYIPFTGAWATDESMFVQRSDHTATALRDGTVLAAGGRRWQDGAVLRESEIYHPTMPLYLLAQSLSDIAF
jgi:hypothetical protein